MTEDNGGMALSWRRAAACANKLINSINKQWRINKQLAKQQINIKHLNKKLSFFHSTLSKMRIFGAARWQLDDIVRIIDNGDNGTL